MCVGGESSAAASPLQAEVSLLAREGLEPIFSNQPGFFLRSGLGPSISASSVARRAGGENPGHSSGQDTGVEGPRAGLPWNLGLRGSSPFHVGQLASFQGRNRRRTGRTFPEVEVTSWNIKSFFFSICIPRSTAFKTTGFYTAPKGTCPCNL